MQHRNSHLCQIIPFPQMPRVVAARLAERILEAEATNELVGWWMVETGPPGVGDNDNLQCGCCCDTQRRLAPLGGRPPQSRHTERR